MFHPNVSLSKVCALTKVFSCFPVSVFSPLILPGLKHTWGTSAQTAWLSVLSGYHNDKSLQSSTFKAYLFSKVTDRRRMLHCKKNQTMNEISVVKYLNKIPLVTGTWEEGAIFWLHFVFNWLQMHTAFPCRNWPCASDTFGNIAIDIIGNWIRCTACTSHAMIAVGNDIFLTTFSTFKSKVHVKILVASYNGCGEPVLKYDDQ